MLRRLRRHLRGLDRPRKVALGLGIALVVTGVVLVLRAPEPPVSIPSAVAPTADMPLLEYVRSLPDAGDPPFSRPVGLAVGAGQLYVSDSGAAVVRVFTTRGIAAGEIGRGTLKVPAYLARDVAAGTVLVTDRELDTVFRFSDAGEPLGEIVPSVEESATWEPLGIAADGNGTIAVTDTSDRHRVLVMDRTGFVTRVLGGRVTAETSGTIGAALDFPNSVALFGNELWVSDSNNRRVLSFDATGALTRLVRVDGLARGLALLEGPEEGDRYVAVADTLTSQIVLLDADGGEVTRYGGPGSTAGRLAFPNDIAYDPTSGQLFVADTGNARVQVWAITWPAERTRGLLPDLLPFSAMALAGMVLGALGLVLAIVALWPTRRTRERALLAEETEGAVSRDDRVAGAIGPSGDARGAAEWSWADLADGEAWPEEPGADQPGDADAPGPRTHSVWADWSEDDEGAPEGGLWTDETPKPAPEPGSRMRRRGRKRR